MDNEPSAVKVNLGMVLVADDEVAVDGVAESKPGENDGAAETVLPVLALRNLANCEIWSANFWRTGELTRREKRIGKTLLRYWQKEPGKRSGRLLVFFGISIKL